MRDPVQRNVPPRPGGGGADASGPGQEAEPSGITGTMSIGEVLGILKPEFHDITVSKIRFLEGAGLVQPDRSASGYRKFSEDDVARLRFVLRAQRDQYLPLRVIRQRLTDLEEVGGLAARGSGERGAWYGGDDLVLLRLARELADYGLEARHLRMYKLFAEREAALFEQVVAPLVRQRNPEARTRARDTIEALAQLGGRMRDLALRSAVHGLAESHDPHR
jgi:DNA-binding transcriptional MerR regulator